jgi:hypothetical protein
VQRTQRRVIVAVALAACGTKHRTPSDAAAPAVSDARPMASDAAIAAPARSEHVVWRLVDNRHAAHRAVSGELVVDAGDIGFARFTRFGLPAPHWHLGQTVDGVRAAIADRFATLEVPLPVAARTQALQITLRVHADAQQSLVVRANGRKAGKVALEPGWQLVAVPVAKGSFIIGENELALETAGGGKTSRVALAWLRIGASHPTAADDQPGSRFAGHDPLAAAAFDAKADAIELADGAELAWYVTIPDGANLVADVPPPCRVEVAARAGDDSLTAGVLERDRGRVDLTPSAGKVVRLALIAHDCPRARIAHAAIALHGAAPASPPKAEPPRLVIVYAMSGARADRLARAPTPALDELAKSSTTFRQLYAQSNEPAASLASLWTSLYPAMHGVRLAGEAPRLSLDAKLPTIVTELAAAGFATLAASARDGLDDADGFARGFSTITRLDGKTTVGQQVVDAAIALLKHRDAPTFLFVGPIDHVKAAATCKPGDDPAKLRAFYDSATTYADQQLGRLVAQLHASGAWDQTMLIVTSDHGEELLEDKRCGHAVSLRDSLVHVPLVIHDPARFPGGAVVDEGVEMIDVMPTILGAIGRASPADAQGAPLESLARGWPRPTFASMDEVAFAMRIGRWKARIGATAVPFVEDVAADPDELRDLASTHPIERRMLTDNLGLLLALRTRWQKSAWGVTTNVTAAGAAALDTAQSP